MKKIFFNIAIIFIRVSRGCQAGTGRLRINKSCIFRQDTFKDARATMLKK